MKNIFFGPFVLAFLTLLVSTLVIFPASASEEFAASMKPYAGRFLNAAEVKKVLTGNTIVRLRTGKRGRVSEVYWYYKTAEEREVTRESSSENNHTSKWIADPVKGYCHYSSYGLEGCSKLRIAIEGEEVKVHFVGGSRERILTLHEGEYSGGGYVDRIKPKKVVKAKQKQSDFEKPAPSTETQGHLNVESRLIVLKRLFDKGLITADEYETKRQEVLKNL